jgi:hypothetical protein
MISHDLAETVKRLKELLPKEMSEPWEFIGGSVWHANAKIGGVSKLCDIRGWGYLTGHGHGALGLSQNAANEIQEAIGKYIAAANPAAISSILDALEGLDKRERAYVFLVGKIIKALGEHEDDDLSLDENVAKLVSSLAEARKGARTKGTVEVCEVCELCGSSMP